MRKKTSLIGTLTTVVPNLNDCEGFSNDGIDRLRQYEYKPDKRA